jgi:hypothetical protein
MLNIFRKRTFFIMFVILTVVGGVRDTPSCIQLMYTEFQKTIEHTDRSINIAKIETACVESSKYRKVQPAKQPVPNEALIVHLILNHKVNKIPTLRQSSTPKDTINGIQYKAKEVPKKNPKFERYTKCSSSKKETQNASTLLQSSIPKDTINCTQNKAKEILRKNPNFERYTKCIFSKDTQRKLNMQTVGSGHNVNTKLTLCAGFELIPKSVCLNNRIVQLSSLQIHWTLECLALGRTCTMTDILRTLSTCKCQWNGVEVKLWSTKITEEVKAEVKLLDLGIIVIYLCFYYKYYLSTT